MSYEKMSGNLRSRRAYHNTYGDNVPENENKDQFQTQGNQPFSKTQSSPSSPFQNQSSLNYNSGPGSSLNTNRNRTISDSPFGDRSTSSTGSFAPGSKVVSSPFSTNPSIQSNPSTSPFSRSSRVPNPNLSGNYPYPSTSSDPNQSLSSGFTPFGGDATSTSHTLGFANVTNPSLDSFSNKSFQNTPLTSQNQSQKFEDRSSMYLDGQLDQSSFSGSHLNHPLSNQNTNAVYSESTFNPNTISGTTYNQNTMNLNNLNRGSNFGQSQGFGHRFQQGQGMANDQLISGIPGELGAQLTKFGQIYNKRLQKFEDDDIVDPPLLDELGINVVDIYNHMIAVILPRKGNQLFLNYNDLSGPLLIFVTFALALMFSGKICFSIIYVLSVFCNLGVYMLFNFMNENYISLSKIVTILGYSLLPLCLTPVIWIFSRFLRLLCILLIYLCVIWSTVSASYLFQLVCLIYSFSYLDILTFTFIY